MLGQLTDEVYRRHFVVTTELATLDNQVTTFKNVVGVVSLRVIGQVLRLFLWRLCVISIASCVLSPILIAIDDFVDNKAINGDEDWRKHARDNADNAQPPKKEPKDLTDDSEKNYSNHVLEGGDLLIKCSKFCRDYKVSPIYFISELSKHLYCMHERYAPKNEK